MSWKKDAEVCKHLRWKGLFVGAETDPLVPNPHDGYCWCVHTQNCLGPDGKVAVREDCVEGRTCWEGRESRVASRAPEGYGEG